MGCRHAINTDQKFQDALYISPLMYDVKENKRHRKYTQQSPLFVLNFDLYFCIVWSVPWITLKNLNTKYMFVVVVTISLPHSHSTISIGGISHVGHLTLFTPQSILANHFYTCWVNKERGRERNWTKRRGGRVLRIWSLKRTISKIPHFARPDITCATLGFTIL